MTDNEKLIEEAAQAIYGHNPEQQPWDGEPMGLAEAGDSHRANMARRQAEAAMAVFEKAHTPTDDEWQALWGIITSIRDAHRRHADDADSSEIVDAILAAGFRRTVVPEPSTEVQARGRSRGKHTDAQMLYMICLALEEGLEGVADIDLPDLIVKMISEHWGTADEDTSPEEAEAALAQLAPYIPDHMRAPEPQRYRAAIEDALPMVGLMRAWNTSPEQIENVRVILCLTCSREMAREYRARKKAEGR